MFRAVIVAYFLEITHKKGRCPTYVWGTGLDVCISHPIVNQRIVQHQTARGRLGLHPNR